MNKIKEILGIVGAFFKGVWTKVAEFTVNTSKKIAAFTVNACKKIASFTVNITKRFINWIKNTPTILGLGVGGAFGVYIIAIIISVAISEFLGRCFMVSAFRIF